MTEDVGLLANVDPEDRLTIPADVLRVVRWWSKKPIDVTAELVETGLIRVYPTEEARPLIARLISDVSKRGYTREAQFERVQVIGDRYRTLKMYGDGRVRFVKEVAMLLGFSLGDQPTLYVQAFPAGFEIMSIAYRADRLAKLADSTTIGLHLIEP